MNLVFLRNWKALCFSFLSLGLVNVAFLVLDADAKTTPPIYPIGFRNYQSLPVNAKGVFFEAEKILSARFIAGVISPNNLLVKYAHKAIPKETFSIFDVTSQKVLQAEIISDQPYTYFYRIVDKTLGDCIYQFDENNRKPECQSKDVVNFKDSSTLKRLLKQGKVEDVSADFFYGLQSAYIKPKSGFKEGHSYSLKYNGMIFNEGNYWVRSDAELRIVAAINEKVFEQITLVESNKPQIEQDSKGSEQSRDYIRYQSMKQDVRYRIPAELEPYRHLLVHRESIQIDGVANQSWDRLNHLPFIHHAWKELRSKCTARRNAERRVEIWGSIQFPELGEKEYKTPRLALQLQNTDGQTCYGPDFFRQTMASGDTALIRGLVCDLSEGETEGVDVKEYLPTLLELAQSADEKTKLCSSMALRKLSD
jgi:hypothetical protein